MKFLGLKLFNPIIELIRIEKDWRAQYQSMSRLTIGADVKLEAIVVVKLMAMSVTVDTVILKPGSVIFELSKKLIQLRITDFERTTSNTLHFQRHWLALVLFGCHLIIFSSFSETNERVKLNETLWIWSFHLYTTSSFIKWQKRMWYGHTHRQVHLEAEPISRNSYSTNSLRASEQQNTSFCRFVIVTQANFFNRQRVWVCRHENAHCVSWKTSTHLFWINHTNSNAQINEGFRR